MSRDVGNTYQAAWVFSVRSGFYATMRHIAREGLHRMSHAAILFEHGMAAGRGKYVNLTPGTRYGDVGNRRLISGERSVATSGRPQRRGMAAVACDDTQREVHLWRFVRERLGHQRRERL